MSANALRDRFTAALDALVERLKRDRSILAALLCGSLAHDRVWERSDIDLALVTIDDAKVPSGSMSLNADGINVHAFLMPRSGFRKLVEGEVQNSFAHALLVKARLLYTHDESIARLCEGLREMGARDRSIRLLNAATNALGALDKAHKWLITRGDLDYTALWILYAATSLAQIEVIAAGRIADREVIPDALALNPAFFTIVYSDLLNRPKTKAGVAAALKAADDYVRERTPLLFALVLDYLREAGEARSASEIDSHFRRHFDIGSATAACEYLAAEGAIAKVSLPARLTRKSSADVEELAFVDLGGGAGEWSPPASARRTGAPKSHR
jgi:hypothetical protein